MGRAHLNKQMKDPYDIVDYRDEDDGSKTPVRVVDRIVEAIGSNGFLHDAAARAGISVETLRRWRRKGVEAQIEILNGRARLSEYDTLTRRCIVLATEMERAESESRLALLTAATKLASGGLVERKTKQTINPKTETVTELVEEEKTLLPNAQMLQWLLLRRWPEEFAPQRVEVSGPDGGPVQVEVTARDKLILAVQGVRDRSHALDVASTEVSSNGD